MNDKTQTPKNLAVALDIGTTKVVALAGYVNEYEKIEIIGIGTVKSEGVTRGVVSNIDRTVRAIKESIEMAEKAAQCKFEKVHVGIAGQHIKSIHHHGLLVRHDHNSEINEDDVNKLIKDMYKLVLPPGDKILHVIPQEYTVDNEQDIVDPIGMSGVRLEANFHIITGQISASRNILKCVEKAELDVADITLEPIASASSVLSDEEKEAGVALVDIGGGTTDITIFKDGIIRHTAVIPFGGNVVTSDIREGCTVMNDQAGGSLLRHIDLLSEYHTGMHTRVGKPVEHLAHGYSVQLDSPVYATSVGLLKNALDNLSLNYDELMEEENRKIEEARVAAEEAAALAANSGMEEDQSEKEKFDYSLKKKSKGLFGGLFKMTKEFFEATPDSEF